MNIKEMMTPPGAGVFTVNTAKERKDNFYQKKYGQVDNIEELWPSDFNQYPSYKKAMILGICSDNGGGILRGANWGPLFLRQALLDLPDSPESLDLGDIRVIPHLLHDKYLNEETVRKCRKALYQNEESQHPVSPLSISESVLTQIYKENNNARIFGIGGDHSVSYPLTKTYLQHKKDQGIKASIIHFDAHTDLLVERLGIDLCFGSWCTHILHLLDSPQLLVQLGIRSSGKEKSHWENTFGVKQYWAQELLGPSVESVTQEIIRELKEQGVQELYVSFDIDAIDSKYASATGTPEKDGLSPEVPLIILKELTKHFPITGADMVEIAPFLNTEEKVNPEPDTTLKVGAAISSYLIEELNRS